MFCETVRLAQYQRGQATRTARGSATREGLHHRYGRSPAFQGAVSQ
jgi:hypothetical protein